MTTNKKILIIEDDEDIRELIALQLQMENHETYEASTGQEAEEWIAREEFDLFLIDRMLPDFSGLDICKNIRQTEKNRRSPIILITALSEPENIIEGLDAGADDYIPKPFDIQVLQARVRAQLRRKGDFPSSAAAETIQAGPLLINEKKRWVKIGEEEIKLTHTEFQILHELAKNPGLVYKRRDLIDKVLGGDVYVTNRTIDTHIAGLRKKLGNEAYLIETIRGVGYRFQE